MTKTTIYTLNSKLQIKAYAGVAKVEPDGTPFCNLDELQHVCERMPMCDLVRIYANTANEVTIGSEGAIEPTPAPTRFMNRGRGVERIWVIAQLLKPITTEAPAETATGDTKKDKVLAMLRRPNGATGAELQAAMGWQAHTVRGFIAGTVRGKMGLNVTSAREADTTRYTIA